MIPYGRQNISDDDIEAVTAVLRSDFLTQGQAVPAFEQAVASKTGAGFALATNSATSALHIACLALGLQSGDLLWTTPITFVASANCARYCGADVDFVDIDPATGNMSPAALKEKFITAEKNGRLPKVIVPVHLCGQSCDMAAISALARHYGCHIIEDASHAIGGQYQNEPVGCGRFSDITVFSFHPVKIITTGEGGMALTNSAELAHKMALYRSHGISRDEVDMTEASHGPWYYQQTLLGFNYRMTDIQAALGLSQLTRLDSFVLQRRELAAFYDTLLADVDVTPLTQLPDSGSAWHLYVVQIDNVQGTAAANRKEVFNYMREQGVGVNVHYIPVHLQPYYRNLGFSAGDYPAAEDYYRKALTIPLYPDLTTEQQRYISATLIAALAGRSGVEPG